MSELVTLYAVNDSWTKPRLVVATAKKTKGHYYIQNTEDGDWPHKLRMRREEEYFCHDEPNVHLTPQDAITAYLERQDRTRKCAEANIVTVNEMLREIDCISGSD